MARMAYVGIRETTLRDLRSFARAMGRDIAGDLADDLILLGIEEYYRAAGNALSCNICKLRVGRSNVSTDASTQTVVDADDNRHGK